MLNHARPSVRAIGAAVVATLVLGSAVGAEAATKKKKVVRHIRTVTLNYRGGCTVDDPAVSASDTSGCSTFGAAGWQVPAKSTEKFVTVTVTDATGQKVPGAFWTGSGANGHTTSFCGSMKDYGVPAGGVVLALDAVGAIAACPGLATQGTVKLVFSNLP
jgi:hypothetical protein